MTRLIKQAFTLIELLVVIAIIGILSGLIVVSMSGATQKATIAKAQVFSNSLRNSLMINMISEWKLDSNINDSWAASNGTWNGSGAGNNLTINYRPSSECVFDQCLDFDGTDDYVDFGDILRPSRTNNRTFSFWVNPRNIGGMVFSTGNGYQSAGGYSEFILATASTITVSYDILNSPYRATFNVGADTSKWNYFTVSFDSVTDLANVTIKLYKNGNYINSATLARRTSNGFNLSFLFGAMSSAADNHKTTFFNGQIDDFRVYDALIPTSQIKEQYYIGLNSLLSSGQIDSKEYTERINSIAINE
jgi:prepilin-type N-terminal cleavage/methylation domain-containing protein